MHEVSELNSCAPADTYPVRSATAYGRLAYGPTMPVKHAVLALVTERHGYGYDLAQRLHERVGPGWQLNASAVYPALDQLERAGHVTPVTQRGAGARSPRLAYAPTPTGEAALDTWLRTPGPAPEPVRSELHLKLAFARGEQRIALVAELAAHEDACATLLGRCTADGPPRTPRDLIDAGVSARMHAELAWLRAVQRALGSG